MSPSPPQLFGARLAVAGMIHLQALPGTPAHRLSMAEILDQARCEAQAYAEAGVDAVLIENMHDRPYLKCQVGPEIVAAMTAAAGAVREIFTGTCGIQVLAGANEAALAVALAAGLDFIRAEGFVFAHVADEGMIESSAASLLRMRKAWGAGHIRIFTDIKKKHSSHAITADVSIAETAHAAEFFCSDGIVLSGVTTGDPVDLQDLAGTRAATKLPILIGSGATLENLDSYFEHASALIVGSYFKRDGLWNQPLDPERVKNFMSRVVALREAPLT